MTSMTGILSLLSALIATSFALSCTQCMSTISPLCSGPSKTCSSGYQCGSTYTESTTAVGGNIVGIVRTCLPSFHCNINGSTTLKQEQVRIATSCCSTDNCTPNIPAFPTIGTKSNGVVCRSCVSTHSTWCYTKETIHCTGDETMCLLQTTKIKGSVKLSAAVRGCATPSICNLGEKSLTVAGTTTEVKMKCTSGGISVHQVVLTPAITCLLLLKLFF
ncbi:phospholipase A2 inhibitor 25 kDa subunit-like [Dendropsophus ebraccatus]|uniref:phospholipase A2 inhibitor 25 kDa subunit-like n=1 Tax=Dendropsophus ebraccatus TaxID=150705 RepID=UPI003831FEF4